MDGHHAEETTLLSWRIFSVSFKGQGRVLSGGEGPLSTAAPQPSLLRARDSPLGLWFWRGRLRLPAEGPTVWGPRPLQSL